jgi:hypothetical protein
MTPSQLEFNLTIREWVGTTSYSLIPSGTDEKIIIKYANRVDQAIFDDQLEEINRDLTLRIKEMAERSDVNVDLEFTDLGFGELGLIIYIKDPPGREEAKEEYYDLLYNSSRLTNEQFARLKTLVKKYGFK